MKRTFTRRELYDLVWSTPISKLAEQFEISDRGLAKICARYHVAVPGRGYWAKVEAGQPATKTPLWKTDNPALETIHIGGMKQQANPYVAFAIEAAQKAVEDVKVRKVTAPEKPQHEAKVIEEVPSAAHFEPVKRPHTSISGLALELKDAKPDNHGEISVPGIRIHKSSRTRTIAFLHHLAISLEGRGISLSQGDRGLKVEIAPDDVRFEIIEGRKREKHEPTPGELKKKQDYDRRREIASRRGQWLDWETFWPEYDYNYSGKLTFEINNWADGARKKWSDGKHQTLESMLDGIADGLLFHLAFDKARREEREENERRRKHMALRRELYNKRQEREAKRIKFIADLTAYHNEATQLRTTIANASSNLERAELEYRRMIDWAQKRLAQLEAQNELATLTSHLRAENLFPDDDPLFDPEGDPPPKQNYWD